MWNSNFKTNPKNILGSWKTGPNEKNEKCWLIEALKNYVLKKIRLWILDILQKWCLDYTNKVEWLVNAASFSVFKEVEIC